jgi:hypothetical protein
MGEQQGIGRALSDVAYSAATPVLQSTGLNFEVRDGAGGEEAERMVFRNMIENGFVPFTVMASGASFL